MEPFRVEVRRGDLVESVHLVSAAVVDRSNRLIAWAGDPDRCVPWRSAAKPFQVLPLLQDGGAERFALTDRELAVACASHSSEPDHLDVVDGFLAKVGCTEQDLACGPHSPLSSEVANRVVRDGITLTPRWSNCSGKHTALLALARHHGWPTEGYEVVGHQVQERILSEIATWTNEPRDQIALMVDGCATVCFGLPIRAMSLAYARFGVSESAACRRLWHALTSHPWLVGGTKRFETELMTRWPGGVFAKVGAEGVYSVALPAHGLGLTIKVDDGAWRAAPLATLRALNQVLERVAAPEATLGLLAGLTDYVEPQLLNTQARAVGSMRATGCLRFSE